MEHLQPEIAESGRRSRKRIQVEQHLVETSFRLFEIEGFENVTMERIAAESDVAKATLYKHFPVKEALLAHKFRQEIETGMAALEREVHRRRSFVARMQYLLRQSAQWHLQKKTYMPHYLRFRRDLLTYGPSDALGSRYGSGTRKILSHLISAAQESREISKQYPAGDLAAMFEHMLVAAVVAWLREPARNLEREFLAALDLLYEGIVNRKDRRHAGASRIKNNALRP